MSSFIPKGLIKLNESVEKISWQSNGSNEVTINAYNTVEQTYKVYRAANVCVTIPLGLLKKNHSTLFNPPLPNNKIQSIERLGFGVLNKIFTVFDKPFKDISGLQLLWLTLLLLFYIQLAIIYDFKNRRDDFKGFELDSAQKWNLKVTICYRSFISNYNFD